MPRSVDPSRDLLFGILTLQIGLIDQGQLVAAFQSWARASDRPLAEHLTTRGDLDAEQRAGIEAMVALHLKKYAGDAERSLAAIPASDLTREHLARLGDAPTEASVVQPGLASTLAGGDTERTATYGFGSGTADSQRFRVLRPHARGGLGTVFVALDTELHREVAVKEILDNHVNDPVSRARFLLEAEVTGGLEHPGIVPVYGLGTYADGRPYYAMRFIRGDSLKTAIEQFHADAGLKSDPGRRSLELRKLLRRFTDVCNAIDYAHNRGVLHRDIKPSNIIVGKYGETLVVDWGLAKPLGRLEPGLQAGERPLVVSAASGSTATLAGSALGTPAFMSPEQADGDLERLGPRSDVYSLGATLYCLLTDKPPAEGADIGAVLGAVRKGEFTQPRKLDPSIDKPLEAVCLKAMALKPDDRYATPRALADDIDRWLADEPVAAYPERKIEQLGRWFRQHRAWTYAAAAGLIGITLAATVGATAIEGGRRREEKARKEAESNFVMAQDAVKDYLTSVSENTLLQREDSVDIRSLRRELLETALKYYKSFVSQRSQDPQLRRQLAEAYFRVGKITQEIGSADQALEAYRSAQTIWAPLVDADRQDQRLQGHLADCDIAMGALQSKVVNLDEAMKSLSQARMILERLTAANPTEADYQSSLAGCYAEIGIVHARLKETGKSLVILEKAKTIQQGLIDRFPDKLSYQKSLAEIIIDIGFAYYNQHDNDAALNSFEEVQEICLAISKQISIGPRPVWLMNLLALAQSNIAWIHRDRGELQKALRSFEQTVATRSVLADSHPSVIAFKEKLGVSYREMAEVQHKALEDAGALQSIRKSIDVLESLVQSHTNQADYCGQLGLSYNYLGILYDGARKNSEAIPAFQQAVAEQELAIAKSKDVDLYKEYLWNHVENLAEQYVDLGHVAEGMRHYARAIELRRQLSAAHPENRQYVLDLATALTTVGIVERHDGAPGAARDSFTQARTILERWLATAPGDAALQGRLAAVLDQEANTLADLGQPEAARLRLERAVALFRSRPERASSDNDGIEVRQWYSEALWDLTRVLRAMKRPAEATAADAERAALWKSRPAIESVDLAFKQLERANVIGYGATPVSEQARTVRELDLDQAAANLQLAIARGFRDLRMLRSHPDSPVLLSRKDVKLLIMDMSFPDRPLGDR